MKTKKLYPILLVALLVALLGILTLGVSAEGEPTVPTTEYAFQIFLKESVTSLPVEAIEGLDAALYADAKIEGDRFYLKLPVITNPMHITAVKAGGHTYVRTDIEENGTYITLRFARVVENATVDTANGHVELQNHHWFGNCYLQGDDAIVYRGALTVLGDDYTVLDGEHLLQIDGKQKIVIPKAKVALSTEGKTEREHTSFEAAANAVFAGERAKITLLDNVEINSGIVFPQGADVTIDLAGHSMTANYDTGNGVVEQEAAFPIKSGVHLTLTDSKGGGSLLAAKEEDSDAYRMKGAFLYVGAGGTLTLEGGTLRAYQMPICVAAGGTAYINGGTLSTTVVAFYAIKNSGVTKISSLTVEQGIVRNEVGTLADMMAEGKAILSSGNRYQKLADKNTSGNAFTVVDAPVTVGTVDDVSLIFTNPDGARLSVDCTPESGGTLAYQWYKGSTPLEDATSKTFTIPVYWYGTHEDIYCLITYTKDSTSFVTCTNSATVRIAPKALTADQVEWVLPPEGAIYKTYDGATDYANVVSVQIKAGVVGASPTPISGRFYFASPNVGEGNSLIFSADPQQVNEQYCIPVGFTLTHEATILPNLSFSMPSISWNYLGKTYDGLPHSYPVLTTSNAATPDDMRMYLVDEAGNRVDEAIEAGTYRLYVDVSDTVNGVGITGYFVDSFVISPHYIWAAPQDTLSVSQFHFDKSAVEAVIASWITEQLMEGDTLAFTLTHAGGCTYQASYTVWREDVDVTGSYDLSAVPLIYTLHFGERWNDNFYCSSCNHTLSPTLSASGDVVLNNGATLAPLGSEHLIRDVSPTFFEEYQIQSIIPHYGDIYLQYLVSPVPQTEAALRASADWQIFEGGAYFEAEGTGIAYVYLRFTTLSGETGSYMLVPARFCYDEEAPAIPSFVEYDIYMGSATVTVTDNLGIADITVYAQFRTKDGNFDNMDKVVFHYEGGALVTTYQIDLIPPTIDFHDGFYSVDVTDMAGNRKMYDYYFKGAAYYERAASRYTADTVRVSDEGDLKDLRAELASVKGVVSPENAASRNATLAYLDGLLAAIKEKDAAALAQATEVGALREESNAARAELALLQEKEEKRLSAGAIIAITAGGTLALTVGGFALLWFVIKRKSLAELISG